MEVILRRLAALAVVVTLISAGKNVYVCLYVGCADGKRE